MPSIGYVREAARVLRPGGVYAANLADGAPFDFLRSQLATFRGEFAELALPLGCQAVDRTAQHPDQLLGARLLHIVTEQDAPELCAQRFDDGRALPLAERIEILVGVTADAALVGHQFVP